MALGDYVKTTFNDGAAPGISAARLNNNENKTGELDSAQAAHLVASDPHPQYSLDTDLSGLAGAGRTTETVKGNAAALAAHQADYVRNPAFGPATGAVNAYTFSAMVATALVDGMSVYLDNVIAANTGASTFNWSGLGAKAIVDSKGNALIAGKMPLNCLVGLRFNASAAAGVGNFQLLGEGGDYGTAGQPQVLTGYTVGTPSGVVGGSMPTKVGSATVLNPSGVDQAIPQGYYDGLTSSGKVAAVNPSAGNTSWTTPGTYSWTVPIGVTRVLATMIGAGAGGSGGSGTSAGTGGGGAGACTSGWATVTPGSTVSVVVGTGGNGGAVYSAGNPGGVSSFGSLTANGGSATTGTGASVGGVGGIAPISSPYIGCFAGGTGGTGTNSGGGAGGGAGGKGGAGGNGNTTTAGSGGIAASYAIIPGGAGGAGSAGIAGSGGTGNAPGGGGAGGGGSTSTYIGGNGGAGAVYIQW